MCHTFRPYIDENGNLRFLSGGHDDPCGPPGLVGIPGPPGRLESTSETENREDAAFHHGTDSVGTEPTAGTYPQDCHTVSCPQSVRESPMSSDIPQRAGEAGSRQLCHTPGGICPLTKASPPKEGCLSCKNRLASPCACRIGIADNPGLTGRTPEEFGIHFSETDLRNAKDEIERTIRTEFPQTIRRLQEESEVPDR